MRNDFVMMQSGDSTDTRWMEARATGAQFVNEVSLDESVHMMSVICLIRRLWELSRVVPNFA
jgi:hypothetical protein